MERKLGRRGCVLLAAGSAVGAGAYTTPDVAVQTDNWPTKPHNHAGAQGKPGKALSPNCRGGSFPGRRQTAATPHAPP